MTSRCCALGHTVRRRWSATAAFDAQMSRHRRTMRSVRCRRQRMRSPPQAWPVYFAAAARCEWR